MRYVPEFDGLRALAVCAVILFHAAPYGMVSGGFVGVDLFFVLSAFLITETLRHNPSLARFYWRRACRLYPALFAMLTAYLVVAPSVWPGHNHTRDAALAGLYLTDYTFPIFRNPRYLQHTWSLAVEEQFYLLWPFVLVALSRCRYPIAALAIAYVAMTVWRHAWPWWQSYYRFDTHATGLLVGAALFLSRVKAPVMFGYGGLAALVMIAATADLQHSAWPITFAELASAAVIAAPPRWLAHLSWLGKRSYAIYLWHFPITYYVRTRLGFAETAAISLVASTAIASLSYVTVEAWGRRLRDKVEQRGTTASELLETG